MQHFDNTYLSILKSIILLNLVPHFKNIMHATLCKTKLVSTGADNMQFRTYFNNIASLPLSYFIYDWFDNK